MISTKYLREVTSTNKKGPTSKTCCQIKYHWWIITNFSLVTSVHYDHSFHTWDSKNHAQNNLKLRLARTHKTWKHLLVGWVVGVRFHLPGFKSWNAYTSAHSGKVCAHTPWGRRFIPGTRNSRGVLGGGAIACAHVWCACLCVYLVIKKREPKKQKIEQKTPTCPSIIWCTLSTEEDNCISHLSHRPIG